MARRTNREFVMLAQTYEKNKHRSAGMYLSEKLDGMRCLWLPQTKGIPVEKLPFANRGKDQRKHIASGLWSRYGKVIHCPDYFTASFPDYPLDGELYLGRNGFQTLMSVAKELTPDHSEWRFLRFMVFDAPCITCIFQDGRINNPQWEKTIKSVECFSALGMIEPQPKNLFFDQVHKLLKRDLVETEYLKLHEQELLPFSTPVAVEMIEKRLDEVTEAGGEGLILRHPASPWEPIRSSYLLKVKKLHDAEAQITNFRTGQGKYLGMLGSVTVNFGGTSFELSGFTDDERKLSPSWSSWAGHNPGMLCSECPLPIDDPISVAFNLGDIITFRYRELTDDGKPKEARYLRKRND